MSHSSYSSYRLAYHDLLMYCIVEFSGFIAEFTGLMGDIVNGIQQLLYMTKHAAELISFQVVMAAVD